jgi:hypothetical protein
LSDCIASQRRGRGNGFKEFSSLHVQSGGLSHLEPQAFDERPGAI